MNNPVAPGEGHYALLRNGSVVHPDCIIQEFDLDQTAYYLPANNDEDYYWTPQGVCQRQTYPKGLPKVIFVPDCDIIATISPADMQAAASGELERLRAALGNIIAAHNTGRYEPLQAAIEAALAKMEESK